MSDALNLDGKRIRLITMALALSLPALFFESAFIAHKLLDVQRRPEKGPGDRAMDPLSSKGLFQEFQQPDQIGSLDVHLIWLHYPKISSPSPEHAAWHGLAQWRVPGSVTPAEQPKGV